MRASIDPLGYRTRTVSDAAGRPQEQTDARGNKTTYQRDKLGRTTSVTDAASGVASVVYDLAGNATVQIDELGNRTTSTYDAFNRRTEVKDALGNVTTTIYDAADNVVAVVNARSYRTTYTVDALNRVTEVKDALGNVGTTVFDAAGNVTVEIDRLGKRTTHTFDNLNRQTEVKDPLGNVTTTVYDALDHATVRIDPLARRTTFTFDSLNRRETVKDALGNATTTVFDTAGRVSATVDARANRTSYTYDDAGRQIAMKDALSHVLTTTYDEAGNVSTTVDALGKTTTYGYDTLNRRTTVQDPGGGIATTVYDAVSNAVNTIDPLGHKGTSVFDAMHRQTKSIDALAGTTTYLYDAVGNRTGLIDPVANRTTWTYDALNRVTQETDPLNKSMTYAYDAESRMTSQTDRLTQRRDYTFDDAGRKTGEVWKNAGGTTVNLLTLTYDNAGNQLTAADANGAYTMTFDADNRVATVKNMWGVTLTMTYDAVGNRTKLEDSKGGVQTSTYDAVNRLTKREFGGSGMTPLRLDQAYSDRNQVTTMTRYSDLAGTTKVGDTLSTYDDAGRLSNLKHRDGSSVTFANFTYTYDLASRVTTQKLNGTVTTYSYDDTNQLTNDTANAYTFDANGNRTMTGYATGTGNRMTNDGTYTYTYDDEGNVTKKSKGASAETWTYRYDNRNQMTSVEKRATDGGTLQTKATYVYDVWGSRIEKAVWDGSTTTERFALDGWKNPVDGWNRAYPLVGNENFDVVADLDGSNALTMRRVYTDQVVQPFARVSAGGTAYWYNADIRQSIVNMMSNSGAVAATMAYDGFGKQTTAPAVAEVYGYDGARNDAESGLNLFGESYYDSLTSRWYRPDPKRFDTGDSNLYRPMRNNPTNSADPSGLDLTGLGVHWAAERLAAIRQQYEDSGQEAIDLLVKRYAGKTAVFVSNCTKQPDWVAGVPKDQHVREVTSATAIADKLSSDSYKLASIKILVISGHGMTNACGVKSIIRIGKEKYSDYYRRYESHKMKPFDKTDIFFERWEYGGKMRDIFFRAIDESQLTGNIADTIAAKLAPDPIVIVAGCGSGKEEKYMKILADNLQATVYANTGQVNQGVTAAWDKKEGGFLGFGAKFTGEHWRKVEPTQRDQRDRDIVAARVTAAK